jgi:hypothetical protein
LKQVWLEAAPTVGGAGRRITDGGGGTALGVARWCWREGGQPTAAADATAGAGAAVEVGRWSRGGTPSGTSEEHYRMEQPQPSSSLFPCGHGWHHPRS